MTTERDLRAKFEALEPALDAWGRFVTETVRAGIAAKLKASGDRRDVDEFLKVYPKYRVKGVGSFIAKALHRGKDYQAPLDEMTDLVGTRFVVLLRDEIQLVNKIITDSPEWEAQKDRDYERDRAERPQYFEYESVHFIVRTLRGRRIGNVDVPGGLPCEVQVRTLLQHAYAELSHDRIYKPETVVADEVRRMVARGSALLETTDQVFCEVSRTLEAALDVQRKVHSAALSVCEAAGVSLKGSEPQVTLQLLQRMPAPVVADISEPSLRDLLERRNYIPRKMKEREGESLLFAHPAGLVAYWLVERLKQDALNVWPFEQWLLEEIAADYGLSLHG